MEYKYKVYDIVKLKAYGGYTVQGVVICAYEQGGYPVYEVRYSADDTIAVAYEYHPHHPADWAITGKVLSPAELLIKEAKEDA